MQLRTAKSKYACILITGANRGMGLGYVEHYLKIGHNVVATYRNRSGQLEGLKKKFPDRLHLFPLDVSKEKSISEFRQKLQSEEIELKLVINNAGISQEENFGSWTQENFKNHFFVNTIGPAMVVQTVVPFMEKGSKIIQITSGMGSLDWNINPENGLDAYAASKSALNSLTIRLAEKLKRKNIAVFLINPGWVKTKMGGEEATYSIDEAIVNITNTIRSLTLTQSGSFVTEKGDKIPW